MQPVRLQVSSSASGEPLADARISLTQDLDHGKPPPWRDCVSDRPYLAKVSEDQSHEQLSLTMRPGAVVRGRRFILSVLEIREPRYVNQSR
ncbi:MAG: hypothetical protein JXQ73_31175 [Phycisphaerae bacterium]|nr:hypothetical protein [Phycisphaerae bacterium]